MSSAQRERYPNAPTYPSLAGKVAVVTGGSGGSEWPPVGWARVRPGLG